MPGDGGKKALVVGAGIAGLSAAMGLRGAGYRVEIVERATEPRGLGAGLSLWPNALAALDKLGVGEVVRGAGLAQDGGAIRDQRGRVLRLVDGEELTRRLGEPVVLIEREALHEILIGQLGDVPVRFDREAIGVERGERPTVVFKGGDRRGADLVVVAEGVAAAIAGRCFEMPEPRRSGFVAWRGIAELDEELDGSLTPAEYWIRGAVWGATRLPRGRAYWWVADREAGGQGIDGEAEKSALLGRVAGWPGHVRELIGATSGEAILRNALLSRAPALRIAGGGVALVGDTAHPMLPHLGQGACQAIEDAVVLASCLSGGGSPDVALADYERRRRQRVRSAVRNSARAARFAHLRGPAAAARNALLRVAPAPLGMGVLESIAGRHAGRLEGRSA
jgi:2-polyprenyl-6-methoxyphenol hydroxylase-like FAD-dependent oxidoreductase